MKSLRGIFLFILLWPVVVLGGSKVTAQALPTATGPASTLELGIGLSGNHIDYGQRWLDGPMVWINYNPLLHLGIEGEARSLLYNQDLGVHGSTFLVGPRVTLHHGPVEPYVKVLAGSGRLTFPYAYAHGSYFVVAVGGGVDLRLNNRLRIRALDISYQQWPRFSFGAMTSYGVSTGLSITLRHGETWLTPTR